jgi:hypothetical protein
VIQKSVVTTNPATCDGPLLKISKSTTKSTTLGATGSAVNLTLVMENAVCIAVLPLERTHGQPLRFSDLSSSEADPPAPPMLATSHLGGKPLANFSMLRFGEVIPMRVSGIVNLSRRGMLFVSVARQLGWGTPLLAYLAARS